MDRFLKLPPRPTRGPRTVCTVCGCLIEADFIATHLTVCPVVHPEKKDK